uniref:Uncharacterized protein n=1 Tax=Pyxicephalus adspersus TaxID=30357 RepID=A0AAV3AY63_PYXAD|nr:TPA: hypothetical protein GDO54_008200 [Pyxicephalus adspersus]
MFLGRSLHRHLLHIEKDKKPIFEPNFIRTRRKKWFCPFFLRLDSEANKVPFNETETKTKTKNKGIQSHDLPMSCDQGPQLSWSAF